MYVCILRYTVLLDKNTYFSYSKWIGEWNIHWEIRSTVRSLEYAIKESLVDQGRQQHTVIHNDMDVTRGYDRLCKMNL